MIDVHGQRVSATDRLYLLEAIPTLIVWGERDHTIPLEHGRAAHEAIPHSRFRTLPARGALPAPRRPRRARRALLREFIAGDRARARSRTADWGAVLARRSPAHAARAGARSSELRAAARPPSRRWCPPAPARHAGG